MWLEYFGVVDHLIFYVFCAVGAVVVILSLVNLMISCVHDCCHKANQPATFSIDFFTSCGCILLTASVLIQGLDTDWGDQEDYEKLCEVYPVILLLGLTMFIGGIFVRAWSLFIFYRYNDDTKVRGQEWKPNLWIWLLVLIMAIVSVVWVIEYTPELTPERSKEYANGQNGTVYQCKSADNDREWKIATSVWHGVLLLLAVLAVPINCCAVRGTGGSCYFQVLSVVTFNTLLATIAGIVVHYELDESDTTMYIVKNGLLLWVILFGQILFLIAKAGCGGSTEGDRNYNAIEEEGGEDAMRTYRSSGSFENATFKSEGHSGEGFSY